MEDPFHSQPSPSESTTTDENSSSSVVVNDINLLTQILLCTPVKSLLVFKSISKQWRSLISDTRFVQAHCIRAHRLSIPGLFLYKPSFTTNLEFGIISLDGTTTSHNNFISFNTLTFVNCGGSSPRGIKIKQSCNGLFCCSSFEHGIGINPSYFIYNPSTRHYKKLRLSPYGTQGRLIASVCSVSLAFDPMKSTYYKAICIWSNHRGKYKIEVYSSERKSWKLLPIDVHSAAKDIFSESGVFWNGSLHWISWTNSSPSLYLDIELELVQTMPMPPPLPDGSRRRIKYFGEYKNHLHLIQTSDSCVTTIHFDILEMEIDYSGWNLKYRVDLSQVENGYLVKKMNEDLVCSFEFDVLLVGEEEEESKLVLKVPNNKVISYDLKEMSFKLIYDLGSNSGFSVMNRWCRAYKYVPTLAPI